MATIQDTLAKRQNESAQQIGNLYNKQYDSQAAQLRTAYDKNVSDAQAAQQKIAPQYQTQANQMAAQYERNRRNLNLQNLNNGMATGTAMQQQMGLNTQFQRNYSGLRQNELGAQADAAQKMAGLTADYQNNLAAARADAENKKAAALVNNQNDMNDWYDNQAKLMSGYGDFSAYERLYGKAAADQMKQVWSAQNPDAAYFAGAITKAQYRNITGRDPGSK